ncbi:MAG: radical SAM protein [Ignisphaera sp.]
MSSRSSVGVVIALIRLFLGNRLVRNLLRYATNSTMCYVDGVAEKRSYIHYALSRYIGSKVLCPIASRFTIDFMYMLIDVGIKILGGNRREIAEMLSDPAVRRGVECVMKGIAEYGVTIPQILPAPFLVVWNFTNICNLRCIHCYQRAGRNTDDELTLSEKLALVEHLDAAGVAAVALSGGEPTLHPDYLTIVKALAQRGIYVAIATNGWRYADIDELKKAAEAGLRYVEVSIDSAYQSKHDRFRGFEGSWNRAVKALENAVKLGISSAMAVTITKLNINEVDEILDLAQNIGVNRVIFFNYIPVGRGKEASNLDLNPIEREDFMKKIYREMKKRKIEIYITAPQYARVVLQISGGKEIAPTHYAIRGDIVTKSLAEFIGGCGAGRIYAAIQPNGDVSPCVFMPIALGNIKYISFERIWRTNKLLKMLRNRENLGLPCRICSYRCICGGCRARAYVYFGDPLAPDPGCINTLYTRII